MEPGFRSTDWSEPRNVPVSLATSLKTMIIGVVEGGEAELAALAYFQVNAQVLRKAKFVTSSSLDDESKSWLIEEISKLCLGSKECEIIYEDEDKDKGVEEDEHEDEEAEEDEGESEGEDESESVDEVEDESECGDED